MRGRPSSPDIRTGMSGGIARGRTPASPSGGRTRERSSEFLLVRRGPFPSGSPAGKSPSLTGVNRPASSRDRGRKQLHPIGDLAADARSGGPVLRKESFLSFRRGVYFPGQPYANGRDA